SASSSFSQPPEKRGKLFGRWQRLVTFPAGFLFDCLGKPAEEIYFFIQGRQNQYRDFYKTFDFAKDFEDKKKAGVFHSVKP
uniref:Uncharacterized protein n=1 Tax=Laticauda laticaudata TaxID=8630 RepID=A0A8C5SNG6_LATLA